MLLYEMKWNEHIFQHQQRFTYVKYLNNLKILWIILAVDCTFEAINLTRIKGKAAKALYPFGHSLSLEKCFFDNSPSSCDIKKQKKIIFDLVLLSTYFVFVGIWKWLQSNYIYIYNKWWLLRA